MKYSPKQLLSLLPHLSVVTDLWPAFLLGGGGRGTGKGTLESVIS